MFRDFKRRPDNTNLAVLNSEAKKRWPLALVVLAMVFFLCGVGFVVSQYKTNSAFPIAAYLSKIQQWMQPPKKPEPVMVAKIKKDLAEVQTDEPIQFVFYSTLPNMQISPEPTKTDQAMAVLVANKSNSKVANVREANIKETNIKVVNSKPASMPSISNSIVKAEELENELAEHLSKTISNKNYVLQLGIFRTLAAAERYKNSVAKLGYQSRITPIIMSGKKVYRVQLGPYNMQQAAADQRELKKTGVSAIVRKT